MNLAAGEALAAQGLSVARGERLRWSDRALPAVGVSQTVALGIGTFLLPLAVIPGASDAYILPKLLLARLLVIVLAALWLIRAALEARLGLRRTPLDVPLGAFVASAGISMALSVNRNLSLFGAYIRYEGLLAILLYAAIFWLTVQSLHEPGQARSLLRILLAGGYALALLAIAQSLLTSAHGVGNGETAFSFGGLARAQGTMGNPNLLATFLAMLVPLTLGEVLGASRRSVRLCWLNVLATMALALALTFGRAAWVGALLGVALVAAGRLRPRSRPRLAVAGLAVVLGAGAVLVLLATEGRGGLPLGSSVVSRVVSIANPTAGSGATRLHVWQDTLRLVASRPLAGYGPDTFGLVYPRFESGNWTPGYRVDKAHSDALQVASTQGLAGLGVYIALQLAILLALWRAQRNPWALPFAGAWLAYEVPTQVNFSWLPAAAPFWLLLAVAMVMLGADQRRRSGVYRIRHAAVLAAVLALPVGLLALLVPAVLAPYAAEQGYSAALRAELRGETSVARSAIIEARRLSPESSVYAVEEGNLDLRSGDILAARKAYQDAVRLGSGDPSAYRSLAVVDMLTGHTDEAQRIAREAVLLDPFNPANGDLLDQARPSRLPQ
jgi:putative inorganic carbon (hco3(-)) transporter